MKTLILQISDLWSTGFGVFFGVFLTIVLFLALRMLVLWYWKVDTIVNLLQENNQLLSEIKKNQESKVISSGQTVEL
jgi:hypothetical protein